MSGDERDGAKALMERMGEEEEVRSYGCQLTCSKRVLSLIPANDCARVRGGAVSESCFSLKTASARLGVGAGLVAVHV